MSAAGLTDVPSAPTNLRASHVGSDSVTLDWSKSRSDGGSPLTGYAVERRDAASNYWTRVGSVDPRKTSFTVTNLRPGVDYYLQVLAENDIGVSDPCALSTPVRITAAAPAAGMRVKLNVVTKTALSRAHNSAKVVDVTKLLLLENRQVAHIVSSLPIFEPHFFSHGV